MSRITRLTTDIEQEVYDRRRRAGKGATMNATYEAQIIAAIERASATAVRMVRHQRLASVTAKLAAPKECRGCGETTPSRDLVNVSPLMRPRWLCRSCAEAGR